MKGEEKEKERKTWGKHGSYRQHKQTMRRTDEEETENKGD